MKFTSAVILSILTAFTTAFSIRKICAAETDISYSVYGAFSVNDAICTGTPGKEPYRQITEGNADYKPSWSPDGKWIVFFRIVNGKNQPIPKWKTKICVVKSDGTGLRFITSGEFADFNPTWTRDGKNNIIINRYDPAENRGSIYLSSVNSLPGDEKLISDPEYSEFGHCGLKDGRIIIATSRGSVTKYLFSSAVNGLYSPPFIQLLTPASEGKGTYEIIKFDRKIKQLPNRVTLSPDEKHLTYELDTSNGQFGYAGHPLAVSDFDTATGTAASTEIFYSTPPGEFALYPSWTRDSKEIVFFAGSGGSAFQFYKYSLETKNISKLTNNAAKDVKYFCAQDSPK